MNLLEEQQKIRRALLYYWSCEACKTLGWDKYHHCPDNNKDCGIFLYNKLKQHFETIIKASAERR